MITCVVYIYDWLAKSKYQFCSVVTNARLNIFLSIQCILIRCVWAYINGSQSLVVISIQQAKDTLQTHTVVRCAQKKIVTADRELTQ